MKFAAIKSQKDHVIFWCICATYFFLALLMSPYPAGSAIGKVEFYFKIWAPFFLPFIFIFWASKSIVFLFENRSEGLIGLSRCWKGLRSDYLSKDAVHRFLMVFPLIPFFNFSYSSIKQTIPIFSGATLDLKLQKIDFFLHGGNNPWELLQHLIGHPLATKTLDVLYLLWGSLLLNTFFWMALSKRKYLRRQFFLSLIFCWIIIGNVLARILASVGPCYFSKVANGVPDPYVGMLDYLHSIPRLKAVQIQSGLWQAQTEGIFMPLGGISAMPSMHVSIAVLIALVFYRVNLYLGIVLTLFAIAIQIGSVHLGWHYAIDGYLSALLTLLIWKGTEKALPCIEWGTDFPGKSSSKCSSDKGANLG